MKKILVIDDDEDILVSVKDGLTMINDNISVTTVKSAKEALAVLENEVFDLMILDLMMPEMDGWSFLEKVHSENNEIPIFILTAKDDSVSKGFGKMCVSEYFIKPLDIEALNKKINDTLK